MNRPTRLTPQPEDKIDDQGFLTTCPEKPRKHKKNHQLHLCNSGEALVEKLGQHNIDLVRLVYEFVKPKSRFAVIVTGSIANSIGTEVSDLDVLVLVDNPRSFKSQRDVVAGQAVKHLPSPNKESRALTMFLDGIEVDMFLKSNPAVADEPLAQPATGALLEEDKHQLRFLGRLGNGWIIHNPDMVKQWQDYYQLDKFRVQRMTASFLCAGKNLEDMRAGIGQEQGHVGMMGVFILTHLFRALLAYEHYCFQSPKFMRKVSRLIDTSAKPMSDLLRQGRALIFPSSLTTIEQETEYFTAVCQYCAQVKVMLSNEADMAAVLESVIYDFDMVL